MSYHRFQVGQTVVAPSGVRDALIPPGPYVIIRLLPPVGDAPHYRVKSAADGHERALLEGQIRLVMEKPSPEADRAPTSAARQRAAAKLALVEKRTATKPVPKKAVRRRR